MPDYETSVFVNCPFDEEFAPLLEAILFCIVRADLTPRLASERLEAGESRLEKIIELISGCKFSVHDLSRGTAKVKGESLRMNMPFELGIDLGWRRAPDPRSNDKKFIIFENQPYELKKSLSDLGGQDVEFHRNDYQLVFEKLRNFLRVEVGRPLPGATNLSAEYDTFQAWMIEKKISEGLTENEALRLPTGERLEEMRVWNSNGRPVVYSNSP